MSFWDVEVCNDPYNDYDLVYSLYFMAYDFSLIEQTKSGLKLTLFDHRLNLPVPIDWMLKIMFDAQKYLPASKIKNIKNKKLKLEILDEVADWGASFELYKGKKRFASIIQTKKGLYLVIWHNLRKMSINFDWLLDVMKRAKKELPAGKIENMGEDVGRVFIV
jgi:hypothetical protein